MPYRTLRDFLQNERPSVATTSTYNDPLKFPQNRFSATRVISGLFLKPSDTIWFDDPNVDPEPKDHVLYLGCNILQTPYMLSTCVELLKKMRIDFALVGGTNVCCGSPLLAAGKVEAAESFDRKRLRFFEKFLPKIVIEWDESCNEFTRSNTMNYVSPNFRMMNIEQFIAENIDKLYFVNRVERRAVIHDHYGHDAAKIADYDAPRKVLKSIPGLEIVEMPHSRSGALECGFEFLSKGMKQEASSANEYLLREAKSSGADTLVAFWQACYRTLASSEVTHGITTVHFIELVAEAVGIPHHDKFKEYKISNDLERVLNESRENIEANGYTLDEIRPYVRKYMFGVASSFS